jgi:two-component system nitrate/nitrite response regulator NarL
MEDHQSIIDGYMYRLNAAANMEVIGTIMIGENIEPFLASHVVDVLLLDIYVPVSSENRNPYPVLYTIPPLLRKYPNLHILAISVNTDVTVIEALMKAGVRGYICKDDTNSIQQLPQIVDLIAKGGTYFSEGIYQRLQGKKVTSELYKLTAHQRELLSFCLAYPDMTTDEIALKTGSASSTVRNTLSDIYTRLGVHTKAAAISKAQTLGLLGTDGKK